jgi:hypothetical protein
VNAFNVFSIGKGHLAKAAVPSAPAADDRNGAQRVGTFCGSGSTAERDALLAKIKEAKRIEPEAE